MEKGRQSIFCVHASRWSVGVGTLQGTYLLGTAAPSILFIPGFFPSCIIVLQFHAACVL